MIKFRLRIPPKTYKVNVQVIARPSPNVARVWRRPKAHPDFEKMFLQMEVWFSQLAGLRPFFLSSSRELRKKWRPAPFRAEPLFRSSSEARAFSLSMFLKVVLWAICYRSLQTSAFKLFSIESYDQNKICSLVGIVFPLVHWNWRQPVFKIQTKFFFSKFG